MGDRADNGGMTYGGTTNPTGSVAVGDRGIMDTTMTVAALAARVIDRAIGAPAGTTPAARVAWHSPAIRFAYAFAHRAANRHYRGADGIYRFDAAAVTAFDARIDAMVARLGDSFAARYAGSVRPVTTQTVRETVDAGIDPTAHAAAPAAKRASRR